MGIDRKGGWWTKAIWKGEQRAITRERRQRVIARGKVRGYLGKGGGGGGSGRGTIFPFCMGFGGSFGVGLVFGGRDGRLLTTTPCIESITTERERNRCPAFTSLVVSS